MPRKKKETTMLVRSVPLDVSERVRRYCRREGIKRREFVERAIGVLEGPNGDNDQGPDHENATDEKVNPMQRVDQIAEQVKAYRNAIRLGKEISKIFSELGYLGGRNVQMNAYLELLKIDRGLTEIIEKFIPKHEIPDDPQARKAMGLPQKFCVDWFDLTEEQWQERQKSLAEAAKGWKTKDKKEDDELSKAVRRNFEETLQQLRQEGKLDDDKPSDGSGLPPFDGQEPVQSEPKPASAEPIAHKEEDGADPHPKKKGIKTSVFGRGFPGVDEE